MIDANFWSVLNALERRFQILPMTYATRGNYNG